MVSKKDCRRRNMQNWLTVLKRLLDWLLQNREPEAVFLWLYRDAGAGKPSIFHHPMCSEFRATSARELLLLERRPASLVPCRLDGDLDSRGRHRCCSPQALCRCRHGAGLVNSREAPQASNHVPSRRAYQQPRI